MSFPFTKDSVRQKIELGLSNQDTETIISQLNKNSLTILNLVENLETVLNDKDVEIRLRGTKLLSDVLTGSSIQLSELELEAITIFYKDRLHDHHSFYPTLLQGISSLVKQKNVSNHAIQRVVKELFQVIPCQSQTRQDRENYFQIIECVGCEKSEAVKPLGDEFLYGVINAIEGERDPRNLVTIFTFVPKLLRLFQLNDLKEEMFDVLACYFPIDFNPSASDLKIVTREELAEKLSDCLCGTNEFTHLTIELLLEKLNSDLPSAKLDSLMLLDKCLTTFTLTDAAQDLNLIWNTLREHINPTTDAKVLVKALESLTNFLRFISSDDPKLNTVLSSILGITAGGLTSIKSKNFDLVGKLMVASFKASPTISVRFFSELVPILVSQIEGDNGLDAYELCTVFDLIEKLVEVCKQHATIAQLNPSMVSFIEIHCVKQLLHSDDNVAQTRISLKILSHISAVMTPENRNVIYCKVLELILKKRFEYESQIYQVITEMARIHSDEVNSAIVQNICLTDTDKDVSSYLIKTLVRLLFVPKLETVVYNLIITNVSNTTLNPSTRAVILSVLRNTLSTSTNFNEILLRNGVIEDVIKLCCDDVSDSNSEVLVEAANVMKSIIFRVSVNQQQTIMEQYLKQIDLSARQNVYLLNGLICCLDSQVNIESYFEAILKNMVHLSMRDEDSTKRDAANLILCYVFNKVTRVENKEQLMGEILQEILADNLKAINTYAYALKGLVVKSGDYEPYLESLCKLLNDPSKIKATVEAFRILVENKDQQLKLKKGFLNEQKLFCLSIRAMRDKLEQRSEYHVLAFLYVVQQTPLPAIKMEINLVSNIIFDALKYVEQDTVQLSVYLLQLLLEDKNDFIVKNVDTVIKELTNLLDTRYRMTIRISALKCFKTLTTYPVHVLLMHKTDVTCSLSKALDDPKRLVRNAAVTARLKWYLIDAETSDE